MKSKEELKKQIEERSKVIQKLREQGNVNIQINVKRVLKKVLENMEVSLVLNKENRKIIEDAVVTTIWELFERKEERLKEAIKFPEQIDKKDYNWEFK